MEGNPLAASASSSPAHEFTFAVSLQPSSTAYRDLTPADDIFFDGHLLPLHLLPRLPASPPRSSTASLDHTRSHSFNSYEYSARRIREHLNDIDELPSNPNGRAKAKSFSLFGRRRREDEGHKKKPRFDMIHFLKRYTRRFSHSKGTPEDIHLMRPSPPPPPSNADSTMEELQAAIQAAIAHCKDSISGPEKLKS